MKLNNLVTLLRLRTERQGCESLYTFLGDGEVETAYCTFGQLDQRARAIGAHLQQVGLTGERALLVFPSGLEFISAFFGCLYAGVVAVPVPLMGLRRACSRLHPILQDAGAKAILGTENVLSKLKGQESDRSIVSSLIWLSTDTISDELADDWKTPRLTADSLAYLQYTSGSTADPKGVMVTHGNVLHNLAYIEQGCEYTPESILMSWLPHFHDMGLVNGILQPLFQGCRGILMPPQTFVQRPIRWLRAISQYRASHSGGPNFAYEMCVSKITPEERKTLDLRSWILAYCGAEPVHRDTLVRFAEIFQPHGFSWAVFCPCYGLAETTLKVSAKPRAEEPVTTTIQAKALEMNQVVELEPNAQFGKTLVSSGRVGFGLKVVIVDPETSQLCSHNTIGEIWVSGPSVTRGYWNREQETQDTFQAFLSDGRQGPFLRTGDLGFVHDGQLFVTGRLKDLIIIRGSNYYPQDIEYTVGRSHASLRHGCGAVFSVEQDGEEKLVVVQELKRRGWEKNTQGIMQTIRQAVAEEHTLQVCAVLLVRAGSIPKTSSGKVQRQACREAYRTGRLTVIAESVVRVSIPSSDALSFFADELVALNASGRAASVQAYLKMKLSHLLGRDSDSLTLNDRLTALGLDSLMVFELRQNIENVFGVVVPFSMLLDGPSLGELAQEIGHKMDGGSLLGNEPRTSSRSEGSFPTTLRGGLSHPQPSPSLDADESLSYGQQGLWMLQQEAPETDAFHIRFSARVSGDLDVHAFQKALRALIYRHPALRTTFHEREGHLRQKVRQVDEAVFRAIDASDCSTDVFKTMLAQEAYRPFDLKNGPLLRVLAFARGPKEWVLLMVVHHLNIDLWSMAILVDELRRLYIAEKDGRSLTLADLPSTYSNFVRWQADYLAGPDGKRLWNYWRDYLKGDLPVLRLPTDRPRFPDQDVAGAAHTFQFSTQLTQQLKALAHQQGTTLFVILLSAFQVLLSRYTNQEDFVIGSPVAGRTRPEFEGVLGYFVNVLPFRAELSGTVPFTSLLSRNHRTVSQGLDHQEFPFSLLVERLGVQRDPGVLPLCQVMLVYERPHRLENEGLSGFILGEEKARLWFGDVEMAPYPLERRSAEMDVTLFLAEVGDTLQASFQYRTALFDRGRMERMAEHLMTLLEGIVSSPQCQLSELPMVTPSEQQHMLIDWNQTLTKYPRGCSIQEVFEAQVEGSPDQKAVVFQGASLTYRELNERANQVAHYLQELGIEPDRLVGICMERSLDMVIGLLGVLKAGGAYVPLDPHYPEERLRFMMDDTHMTVLLTQEQFRTRLDRTGLEVACLDSEWSRIEHQSTDNPRCTVTAEALAYVMYTSGSTGRPKGVCIPHRGVVRLVKGPDFVDFNADQVFLQLAPLSFDPSTFEIWGALLNGASLVLSPPHQLTFDELAQIIHDSGITTMRLTADMFHRMVETHLDALAPLKQLVVGGDVLSVSHVNRALEALPNCRLVNGYGPTENTTYTCCYSMTGLMRFGTSIPIGRPIANTQIYILDANQHPVPVGVVGELYVGGDGLARGYLNRPDLTAQTFIPHPFMERKGVPSDEGQERVYKTGDFACYQHDGTIEFHGRVDLQVKVRGYRVELKEVEAVIRQHPGIHDVIVAYRDIPRKRTATHEADVPISDKRLVAYIVPVKRGDAVIPSVRSFLESTLPSYMIPALTVVLDALPRLPNEKIDRQALPTPDVATVKEYRFSRLPRDPIEEVIVDIWQEVLGVDEIGIDDNFFNLGGHSLLIIQVLSRVKRLLQVGLPVRAVFESPTVESFARRVTQARQDNPPISEIDMASFSRADGLALSFSQERMWFLHQLEQSGTAYTMPLATRLSGPLQCQVLEDCINEIRRRHEVLRTTFESKEAWPVPVIHPFEPQPLPIVDLQEVSEHERAMEFHQRAIQDIQQPFDLISGPVFRATLFRIHDTQHMLLVTMHHIITDTWSLSVFFQELETLYSAFACGRPSPLPALPVQYADFAIWQRKWLAGKERDRQLAYWTRQLAEASPILNLPTDHPRPVRQTFRGAREIQKLSPTLMNQLEALSRREGVTLFMVMLAVFKVLLFRYTGQEDVLVGTPVANRRWIDTEKLIGAFVNTLVLRSDLSGEPTFRTLLAQIKETALEAYANQDLPFEQLLGALQPQRDLSRTPLFQVMFSMPNVPMSQLQLAGLDTEVVLLDRGGAQFDLTLFVLEIPGKGQVVMLEYDSHLFEPSTVTRLLSHYQNLLEEVVENIDQPIATLSIMAEAEQKTVLEEWNDTEKGYSTTQCLHQLVEQQVEKTPHALAVVCEDDHLTYRELNQRANQLAHYLRKIGVTSEVLVGILLDRSVDMLVSLLGILKAGGAYVPLDPAYPKDRIGLMLEDSNIAVLITQDHLLHHLPQPSTLNRSPRSYSGPQVLTMHSGVWAHESLNNPSVPVHSTNLAYVIYTSGSTGKPKGVMISHRGVVNFLGAMQREPGLEPHDRLLAVTNPSFDIAALELFLPLVVGAQVVLASRETVSNGAKLCRLLDASKATVMQGTPATWRLLLQAGWQAQKGFRALCGGEALSRVLANQLLAQGVELWNLYGPTETTIWSAVHRVVPGEEVIPLGHPIANTQLYVLDRSRQPVPIGVPGELYIGGEGLARGYVNQPVLTDQQFIPNPFLAEPLSKLYKTGDLVKYRLDGMVEFLGRLDHQVKLRGFRIELEEVEAILNTHPAVQHCVAVVREQGLSTREEKRQEPEFEEKHLVAYVVPTDLALTLSHNENSKKESYVQDSCISELRKFLGKRLPRYMVPSSFVFLETLPLTPNGKMDRQKLLALNGKAGTHLTLQVARTPFEHRLVEIWKKTLGRQHVGVRDDFFELGGHSLLANYVLSQVHSDLGVEIALPTFFEQPTIEHLAKHIEMVSWLSESKTLAPCAITTDREDQLL